MDVEGTVRNYLVRIPAEEGRLERLLAALRDGSAISSRGEFRGHVTCGAVILRPDGNVLHIRHNVLRRWLLPGGHLEPADPSLLAAARREAEEETGLGADDLRPVGDEPLDIDVHLIPANPGRGEPEHPHFDFRYAFELTTAAPVRLQVEEVSGFDWRAPEPGLAEKLVRPRR